jgi:hypothetical protein
MINALNTHLIKVVCITKWLKENFDSCSPQEKINNDRRTKIFYGNSRIHLRRSREP